MSSRATAPDDASEGTVRGRRRRGSTVVFAVAATAVLLIAGGREYGHTLLWGYDEDQVVPITTTAAPRGERPSLRLAVVGDVGTGDGYEWATAGLVAEAASAGPFDGLILLGDNAYPDGDPERLADTVFDPFGPVIDAGAALLAVLGNHDVYALLARSGRVKRKRDTLEELFLAGDAEDLFARSVSLPCSTGLTDAQQDRVVEAVKAFFD